MDLRCNEVLQTLWCLKQIFKFLEIEIKAKVNVKRRF